MYVIITYDVAKERVTKINAFLKRFLFWVQNSVFEGERRQTNLEKVKKGLSRLIKESDSIRIYKLTSPSQVKVEILGKKKDATSRIL